MHRAHSYEVLSETDFFVETSDFHSMKEKILTANIEWKTVSLEFLREIQEFNRNAPPLANTIVLKREELPSAFDMLDKTGEMPFSITGTEYVLAPLSLVKMTEVKVWLPGIKTSANQIRVWLKRFGTSKVYDREGREWSFVHEPRIMLFEYDKDSLQAITAEYELTKEYMAVSPIGPWLLSVSKDYNPDVDTRDVNEIHVQLAGTFLPCNHPICPSKRRNSTDDDFVSFSGDMSEETEKSTSHTGVVVGTVVGSTISILLLTALVYAIRKRYLWQKRDYTPI
eukprot:m.149145 g.149145  ORF g.149145 m.149145 type:complete len:282 (+) comp38513_c0_seq4:1725-2570(+)